MRELRGKPVVVTFLYTHCEDTCPAQAQTMRGALDELGEDVPALAVAVDPPRDTEESARAFLSEQRVHRADRLRCSGTRAELRPLWDGFYIAPQSVTEEHHGPLHARRQARLPARGLPGLRGHARAAGARPAAARKPKR